MTSSAMAPITKPPIITGLLFLDMRCLLGIGSSQQEAPYLGIRVVIAKLARVALRGGGPRIDVEEHAVGSDREDARQLVRDHDNGRPEAPAQLEDEIVEQPRADRVEP